MSKKNENLSWAKRFVKTSQFASALKKHLHVDVFKTKITDDGDDQVTIEINTPGDTPWTMYMTGLRAELKGIVPEGVFLRHQREW